MEWNTGFTKTTETGNANGSNTNQNITAAYQVIQVTKLTHIQAEFGQSKKLTIPEDFKSTINAA